MSSKVPIIELRKTDVKSDPNNILGLQYNKYTNSLYAQSLTKPSEYFDLRGKLEDKLKDKLVTSMFTTIYDLLRYGLIDNNCVVGQDSSTGTALDRIPGYPSANVNSLSLKITKTFDDFMDEIINILMPPSYMELAKNKTIVKAEAIGL